MNALVILRQAALATFVVVTAAVSPVAGQGALRSEPGTPSENRFWAGGADGDGEQMPSKFSRPVVAGDRFYHRTAGAGSWGDPLDRDADAVAVDLRNGADSVAGTKTIQGAVRAHVAMLREDRPLGIDAEALYEALSSGKWQA